MKAYLLRQIAQRLKALPIEEFLRQRPGSWLVWEAGPWHPSLDRPGTLQYEPPVAAEPPGGEALAIELDLARGGVEVTLGRAPECGISIDDATVSRSHLLFKKTQHTWRLLEAGSRNGSTLDGVKLRPERELPLADGARITAGGARLTYHDAHGFYWRLQTIG